MATGIIDTSIITTQIITELVISDIIDQPTTTPSGDNSYTEPWGDRYESPQGDNYTDTWD